MTTNGPSRCVHGQRMNKVCVRCQPRMMEAEIKRILDEAADELRGDKWAVIQIIRLVGWREK